MEWDLGLHYHPLFLVLDLPEVYFLLLPLHQIFLHFHHLILLSDLDLDYRDHHRHHHLLMLLLKKLNHYHFVLF
tara:strand:- start:44 stop:265 length:222 start_codon:yes stop_codon:yes gene_type:complete